MRAPRTSLKILVPVALILTSGLAGVSLAFYRQHRDAVVRVTRERTQSVAAYLAESCRLAVLAGDREALRASLAAATSPLICYAMVLDQHGAVLAAIGEPPGDDAIVARALAEHKVIERPGADRALVDLVVPMFVTPAGVARSGEEVLFETAAPEAAEVVGLIRIAADRAPLVQEIASVRSFAIQIATFAILASGVVVLLILWIAIIRPIEALRVTTAAVSAGDLTARAPVMGRDEVGDLAADFNLMIERLECSHADQRRNSAEISRKNEELFATAQLLNGVLAGVSDSAIVALDLDGQVVTFNRGAEAVFRCSMHAALGRPFRDFLAADERHHLQEILAFAGRGADVVERVRAMRPDAHELPMLLTVTSRRDTREQQIGFVVVGRDLTREDFEHELMVRNRELEQASRAKNEFLANMSHELRTPLNAIIGFSELLGDGLMGEINAEQHKASDAILQSGRHLLGLINEILDLSKVEAGEMKLAIEVVPCLEPIESAIAVAMPLAEKKRLTLTHDFGEALSATVRCDVARFRQILLNLLGNAIKFTESGGTVHVRVRLEPALVAVDVEDTGIGITPADLGRLFQKFQQLENLHTKRHGGTGLGLALSKALAELQGGTITVQSEAGRGSCFTVWLPRATPLAGAAPRHPGALELPP